MGVTRDVKVGGSSRTGQARRRYATAVPGEEREAVGAVWRERVRRTGIRGRSVCCVAIS